MYTHLYIYIYKRIFRWSEDEFSWFNMFQHEICTTGFELYDNGYLDSALFCITSGHRVPCCWCRSHFVSPREAQGIQPSKNPLRMVWTWRSWSQKIFDWSISGQHLCRPPKIGSLIQVQSSLTRKMPKFSDAPTILGVSRWWNGFWHRLTTQYKRDISELILPSCYPPEV